MIDRNPESIRSLGLDSPYLDRLFIYFMRTVLHLERTGIQRLPLENPMEEPLRGFLDRAMEIFDCSHAPEFARLRLDAERDVLVSQGPLSRRDALGIEIIREMAWQLRANPDVYEYLLSTQDLWGQEALQYAALTFYPNLPPEVREKHHIYNPIEEMKPEALRSGNY